VKGILNKKSKKLSLKKRCTKKNQRFEQNFETLRWNKEIKSTAKKQSFKQTLPMTLSRLPTTTARN
jgi:hypothetical protein